MKAAAMTDTQWQWRNGLFALAWLASAVSAMASTPSNPASYSRTTSFVYEAATGRLQTSTVEPDILALCSNTILTYDSYGNLQGSWITNCSGATGRAKFPIRTTTQDYEAIAAQSISVNGSTVAVPVPAGVFPTTAKNPLNHTTKSNFDPRFGAALRIEDPNGAVTSNDVDDFGRVVRSVTPDGTSVVTKYCILPGDSRDLSSNSSNCPAVSAPELPSGAVLMTHSEPRSTSDVKSGPFVRSYMDGLGRVIRTATESFDGPSQPATRSGAVVVADTVFDITGVKLLSTSSYFLSSGSASVAGSNDVTVTRTVYDDLGRPTEVYVSNPTGSTTQTFGGSSGVSYGAYGNRQSAITRYTYSGLISTVKNDLAQTRSTEKNAVGQEVRSTDTLGAQVAHLYDAFGLVLQTKDALQNTLSFGYDILGRRISTTDPDRGVQQSCYDAIGQMKASQNSLMRGSHALSSCPDNDDSGVTATAVANWITVAYDVLGRPKQQIMPSDTLSWTYDNGTGAIGRLSKTLQAAGLSKTYVYDAIGRPLSSRFDQPQSRTYSYTFASAVSYDSQTGRLSSKTYPTGFKVSYEYTSLGYLSKLNAASAINLSPLPATPEGTAGASTTLAAGTTLWAAEKQGADARLEQSLYAGVLRQTQTQDANSRLTALSASPVSGSALVSQAYAWNGLNNLTGRTDNIGAGNGAVSETFDYDDLNRLKQYTVASAGIAGAQRTVNMQYNALGMMLSKSDVGNYAYGTQGAGVTRPHAPANLAGSVLGYDLNGNLTSATQSKYATLTYTEYDKVRTAAGSAGGINYTWYYDESGNRIRETRSKAAGSTRTTWYLHPDAVGGLGFERETGGSADDNRHFLTAGGVQVGVLVTSAAMPTLATNQTAPNELATINAKKLELWVKDHLGSLVATADHSGALTQRYAYDPFGKRRPADGNYDAAGSIEGDWSPAVNSGTARGFTGHEERDDIGIINMNGRIYDDHAGVFMQADPVVQDMGDAQSYGAYTYVLNNPLALTDPSGFENQKNPVLDRVCSGSCGGPDPRMNKDFGDRSQVNRFDYGWEMQEADRRRLAPHPFQLSAMYGYDGTQFRTVSQIAADALTRAARMEAYQARNDPVRIRTKLREWVRTTAPCSSNSAQCRKERSLREAVIKEWTQSQALGDTTLDTLSLAFGVRAIWGLVEGLGVRFVEKGIRVESGIGSSGPMQIERIIKKGEKVADIVSEAKGLTYTTGNEYAVVTLANGERALVSGGPGGINFAEGSITKIFGHTHPTNAMPSAADAQALRDLGQSRQYVFFGGQMSVVRSSH